MGSEMCIRDRWWTPWWTPGSGSRTRTDPDRVDFLTNFCTHTCCFRRYGWNLCEKCVKKSRFFSGKSKNVQNRPQSPRWSAQNAQILQISGKSVIFLAFFKITFWKQPVENAKKSKKSEKFWAAACPIRTKLQS